MILEPTRYNLLQKGTYRRKGDNDLVKVVITGIWLDLQAGPGPAPIRQVIYTAVHTVGEYCFKIQFTEEDDRFTPDEAQV